MSSTPLVVPAVVLHTTPNYVVLGALMDNPTAVLNTVYRDSKTQTFDLKSLWFDCKVAGGGQGNANPAQRCTIQITGYKQRPTRPSVCEVAGVSRSPSLH